jgi:hypothetical protein
MSSYYEVEVSSDSVTPIIDNGVGNYYIQLVSGVSTVYFGGDNITVCSLYEEGPPEVLATTPQNSVRVDVTQTKLIHINITSPDSLFAVAEHGTTFHNNAILGILHTR